MIKRLLSASTFWLILAVLCVFCAMAIPWYSAELFILAGFVLAFVALVVLVWKMRGTK
jgi:hypothetical protein